MTQTLVCWQCGASLEHLSLPLSRFDECRSCRAALHACKLCEFYNITVAKQCREPIAEEVRDKERANFCDYFQPRRGAFSPRAVSEEEKARAALSALFGTQAASGDSSTPAGTADAASRSQLDDLFGSSKKS